MSLCGPSLVPAHRCELGKCLGANLVWYLRFSAGWRLAAGGCSNLVWATSVDSSPVASYVCEPRTPAGSRLRIVRRLFSMTASCHECDADGAPCTHYSQIGAGVAHALFYVLDVLGCHPSSPGDGHHIISHLIASVHLYILAATASVDRTRANQKEARARDASSHLLRSSPESVMYVCMYVRKSNRTECGERNVVAHVYMLHYDTWLRAGGGVRLRRGCWRGRQLCDVRRAAGTRRAPYRRK